MNVKAVVTHLIHQEVIDYLREHFSVVPNETPQTLTRDLIMERAADAEAIMVFMPDRIDDAFLAACPKLRMVSAALKGLDNIDVDSCSRRGVLVTIVPDLLTAPTADLTIGLLLGLTRDIVEGDRFVRSGEFKGWRPKLYGAGLAGGCVGIVGMGAVGQAVARRLRGFDVRIVYSDRVGLSPDVEAEFNARRLSFLELLSVSDFIILCLPLTNETIHLFDEGAAHVVKPGAYLVNTGRGSLVDEKAVIRALDTGRLAGYAADVFEMEDWSRPDRPSSVPWKLLSMIDRTLFTPHLGSAVDEVRKAIEMEAAANMVQAFNGSIPESAVNKPQGWGIPSE